MQVGKQNLLDEILVWYQCWLLGGVVLHIGTSFSFFFLFRRWTTMSIWLHLESLRSISLFDTKPVYNCPVFSCYIFTFILCFSCFWHLSHCLGIVSGKWHLLECVKSHAAVLNLMCWNRAALNVKGSADPLCWAKSSLALTDKEMFAAKKGQLSETTQKHPLLGW